MLTQPAFTCSKLTIETLEQGVKLTIKTPERRLATHAGWVVTAIISCYFDNQKTIKLRAGSAKIHAERIVIHASIHAERI